MTWPELFTTTSFLNSLHSHQESVANDTKISRYRFLWYVTFGSFLWYFIPGMIFPALSNFAFVTWIWPRNVIVNTLFGMTSGMALFPITFDWAQIAGYVGSPLSAPWTTGAHIIFAIVLWIWIVCPIIHFSNVWKGKYFPFNSYYPTVTSLIIVLNCSTILNNNTTYSPIQPF